MKEIERGRFEVQDDLGLIYTIIQYATVISNASIGGITSVEGSSRFVLLGSNESIHRLKDGTFQIVNTEQILRKI